MGSGSWPPWSESVVQAGVLREIRQISSTFPLIQKSGDEKDILCDVLERSRDRHCARNGSCWNKYGAS
jgi:hypothetical protein